MRRNLCFVVMLAFAGCSAQRHSVFVGTWTLDPARSDVAANDLTFTRTADGRMHSEGGDTAPYDFAIDGGENRTANGRIVTWRSANDGWTMTKSRDGAIVETTRVTLSPDQKTLVTAGTGVLPDGSPFTRTTTYQRVTGDVGLLGLWRSVAVDTGATWDGYVISQRSSGEMVWEIPTDHQVITGPFDGSDLPIVGPGVPPSTTLSARRVSDLELSITMKVGATISEYGTITISADGTLMTELSWKPASPARKSKAVYIKTAAHGSFRSGP